MTLESFAMAGQAAQQAADKIIEAHKSGFKIFYLWYDGRDGRYSRNGYGLHCGDCLEALIDGDWVQTRVEHNGASTHSNGWFLVTHPNQPLADLPVRKEGA